MSRKNVPAAEATGPQYATAGGASVDLRALSPAGSELAQIDAVCNGCGASEYVCGMAEDAKDVAANLQRVEGKASEWARDHASTCRATLKTSR